MAKKLTPDEWAEDREPWQRQPYETRKAYDAFFRYARMPYESAGADVGLSPDRSYRKLSEQMGKDLSVIARWGSRWDWQNRVNAYDAEIRRVEHEARMQRHREWARQAEDNLEDVRNDAAQLYRKLMGRIMAMLESPLYVEEDEVLDDGETVIRQVIPAGWNFNTVARLLQQLVTMAEIITHQGGEWDQVLDLVDYEQLTDEQLERLEAAKNPREAIQAIIS